MKRGDAQTLQRVLDVSPFQRWLGLRLEAAGPEGVEIVMPWREEIVSNPEPPTVHGGILATLIDLAGLYSLLAQGVVTTATADLRVDYHRPAAPGPIRAKGRVIRSGSRVSTAETALFAEDGTLLASGRGTYLSTRREPSRSSER